MKKYEIMLDEEKVGFLKTYGDTVNIAIDRMINLEIKRKRAENLKNEEDPFIREKVRMTRNYKDVVTLKELYEYYYNFMLEYDLKPIISKQALRKKLEDMGFHLFVIKANKKAFRFMILENLDELEDLEEEEWEL
jgi:hypothetical protein